VQVNASHDSGRRPAAQHRPGPVSRASRGWARESAVVTGLCHVAAGARRTRRESPPADSSDDHGHCESRQADPFVAGVCEPRASARLRLTRCGCSDSWRARRRPWRASPAGWAAAARTDELSLCAARGSAQRAGRDRRGCTPGQRAWHRRKLTAATGPRLGASAIAVAGQPRASCGTRVGPAMARRHVA
jgi:hypothetical protein